MADDKFSPWEIAPYTRGTGLETGPETRCFQHFLRTPAHLLKQQSLDFVFCRDFKRSPAVVDWWRLIKHGGHLVLIGDDAAPELDHYDQLRAEETSDGLFQVYRRKPNGNATIALERIPENSVAIVRLGGYGDAIQASSIFPWFKRNGYHVTVYVHPVAHEVLKHDPNVDRFYVQDPNQVPHELLLDFWNHERAKYQRWVNLSESVEGSLLFLPDRATYDWPHELRHETANRNYLEFTHAIAGVPFEPSARFHATDAERAWAKKTKAKAGAAIVWSLSGSSIHKVWPHMDTIIKRILLESAHTKVVLVGGKDDALLQEPWRKQDGVWCKAGEWSIRESMAFAEEADLVIGSETGLLNACGLSDVPKIVCLSHSSEENLTKHWKNTTALMPTNVSCYPCHRLIYQWAHCNKHEATGTAMCQAMIGIEEMWSAIQGIYRAKRLAA